LNETVSIIKGSFPPESLVARVGGDEFAVLVPGADTGSLEELCERLQDDVRKRNVANPRAPLSLSVGCAATDETPPEKLLKKAEDRLARVKLQKPASAKSSVLEALSRALEERDFATERHADNLLDIVVVVGKALRLPERRLADLKLLARFHDIGKIGVPDRILLKPGPLTPEERREMERHCEIGRRIAQGVPELAPVGDLILRHHEWWNGGGYPLKLRGEEIPLECRIISLADAYDAMTSDRPYRKALPREKALAEIMRCAGTQFDPALAEKFVCLVKAMPQTGRSQVCL